MFTDFFYTNKFNKIAYIYIYIYNTYNMWSKCILFLAVALFTFVGFVQMTIWAKRKHKIYTREFKDYPKLRKSILPFILWHSYKPVSGQDPEMIWFHMRERGQIGTADLWHPLGRIMKLNPLFNNVWRYHARWCIYHYYTTWEINRFVGFCWHNIFVMLNHFHNYPYAKYSTLPL